MKPYLVLATTLLAACASFDNFEAGKSREADLTARLGAPRERIQLPGGDTLLYYSRMPEGRRIYLATVGPDGVLKNMQQTLSRDRFSKLVPGSTTAKEARELLGPPARIVRMERLQRDVWEYP